MSLPMKKVYQYAAKEFGWTPAVVRELPLVDFWDIFDVRQEQKVSHGDWTSYMNKMRAEHGLPPMKPFVPEKPPKRNRR